MNLSELIKQQCEKIKQQVKDEIKKIVDNNDKKVELYFNELQDHVNKKFSDYEELDQTVQMLKLVTSYTFNKIIVNKNSDDVKNTEDDKNDKNDKKSSDDLYNNIIDEYGNIVITI